MHLSVRFHTFIAEEFTVHSSLGLVTNRELLIVNQKTMNCITALFNAMLEQWLRLHYVLLVTGERLEITGKQKMRGDFPRTLCFATSYWFELTRWLYKFTQRNIKSCYSNSCLRRMFVVRFFHRTFNDA